MVIVRLNGGLGNQMFQMALYFLYKERGIEVKLDRSKYSHWDEKRKCILDYECFELNADVCTAREARKYVHGTSMFHRILLKFVADKNTHYFENSEYEYDENILKITEGYVDGYWQTWKYMVGIEDVVREKFKFVNEMPRKSQVYFNNIMKNNSVAVHVRRGDYIKVQGIYGNICTEKYYKNAISRIEKMADKPEFYFFSDDIEWTKKTFSTVRNSVFVSGHWADYIDLQLMINCKHMIMANSSFSWWAAFLNTNKNKIVICPEKWINTKIVNDIYCNDWIREFTEWEKNEIIL